MTNVNNNPNIAKTLYMLKNKDSIKSHIQYIYLVSVLKKMHIKGEYRTIMNFYISSVVFFVTY